MEEIRIDIDDNMPTIEGIASKIMVIGVGGAGGNAVEHMQNLSIKAVNLVVCNTDIKALRKSKVSTKICLGDGLGAGNVASVGAEKARGDIEKVREVFKANGTELLFIAAGMGAGTGTGASPVIAELAHEMGIVTIAIVTIPPANEGDERINQAKEGVEKLRQFVDTMLIISNDSITKLYPDLPLTQAFDKANDILALAANGIAEVITKPSNCVSTDMSDVKKVVRNSGCALMGVAVGEGTQRAADAVNKALSSPLFGGATIKGARQVLVNIATSNNPDFLLRAGEQSSVLDLIQEKSSWKDEQGVKHKTNIIWGTIVKPELEDKFEVIVVATGIPKETYDPILNGIEIGTSSSLTSNAETVPTATTMQPFVAPIDNPVVPAQTAMIIKEVEDIKRNPAYKVRKVELITKIDPKAPVIKEEKPESKPDEQPQKLF